MVTTVVDLRYKMKDVLKALSRRERVSILYHGKTKGYIIPAKGEGKKSARDFPFFGMFLKGKKSVPEVMAELRGGRNRDL